MQVEYYKDHNSLARLAVTLKVRTKRYGPHMDALIQFYAINDTSRVLLEEITTDTNGEAIYFFDDANNTHIDSAGIITIVIEYKGTASIKSARKTIQVKPAGGLQL